MKSILKAAPYVGAAALVFFGGYFAGGGGDARDDAPALDEARVRAIVESYVKENPVVIMQSVNDYQQHGRTREIAARAAPYRSVLESLDGAPFVGAAQPEVRIVEFFDYQCPHCKANYPVLKRILAEDPTIVLLPKQLPILGDGSENDMSRFAAKAALAAHLQGRFADMHEGLMESEVPISRASVFALAASLNLDIQRLKADMEGEAVSRELADLRALADSTGFLQTGTPGYLIGDQVTIGSGADAYDRLRRMIEAARPKEQKEQQKEQRGR